MKSAGRQWRESLGISGGTLSSKATSRCLPPLTIDCQLCSPASDLADLLMETQNPNFSLRFIANVCKQYVESEMTDRSTLVWELLRVKDGLSSLSNEQFNVLDV